MVRGLSTLPRLLTDEAFQMTGKLFPIQVYNRNKDALLTTRNSIWPGWLKSLMVQLQQRGSHGAYETSQHMPPADIHPQGYYHPLNQQKSTERQCLRAISQTSNPTPFPRCMSAGTTAPRHHWKHSLCLSQCIACPKASLRYDLPPYILWRFYW